MIKAARWAQVRGYPNYFVNAAGQVKNARGRLLSQHIHTGKVSSYLRIMLSHKGTRKNLRVHRLVAMAFCHRESWHSQVNHKDGNTFNNIDDNLEWTTQVENCYHRDHR